MKLGFGFSMRQVHEQRLSMAQRQKIELRMAQLNLDLIEVLWGVSYTPQCKCHRCGHNFTLLEILKGFSTDVNDTEVTCPICLRKVSAKLIAKFKSGRAEIGFYCPSQTTERLRGLEHLSYDELNKIHPILLHSANVHFGNVSAAFAKVGIDYPLTEKVAWTSKVQDFLGKLPDGQIAEVAGVSRYQVTKFRRSLGIGGYKKRDLLPT